MNINLFDRENYILRNVKWTGSKREFVELVHALYEAGLVKSLGKHNCKNKVIENLAECLNIKGVGNHTSIHSNRLNKPYEKTLPYILNEKYRAYKEELHEKEAKRQEAWRQDILKEENKKRSQKITAKTELRDINATVIYSKESIELQLPEGTEIDRNSKEFKILEQKIRSHATELVNTIKLAKRLKK